METFQVNFKYRLAEIWINKISTLEEFANGATQVTVRLMNGCVVTGVLVSDSTYIIAVRGYKDLPFAMEDIVEIFQTTEDKNPSRRGGWDFWDDWQTNN